MLARTPEGKFKSPYAVEKGKNIGFRPSLTTEQILKKMAAERGISTSKLVEKLIDEAVSAYTEGKAIASR